MRIYATAVLVPVIAVNLIRELRVLAILAGIANFFLLIGIIIILQACIRQPSQYGRLPAATNFYDSMLLVGTAMYAFEGQAAVRSYNCTKSLRLLSSLISDPPNGEQATESRRDDQELRRRPNEYGHSYCRFHGAGILRIRRLWKQGSRNHHAELAKRTVSGVFIGYFLLQIRLRCLHFRFYQTINVTLILAAYIGQFII